jgi:hypothetical protein
MIIYLLAIITPIILWVFFLAYSALRQFWHLLRWEVKAVGVFVVLIGFVIDVAFNWTIGLLLGITPDATFSQKCKRLKAGGGWRAPVARYLCDNWLNPFDPEHC